MKDTGSDKDYSAYRPDSDSELALDSPSRASRASRVGLRSGRNGPQHSTADKIASRTIKQPNGCWEIQGVALHSGHVQICVPDGSPRGFYFKRAHVFAWEQANGQRVPKGLVVMHSCDQPRCVNPAHLSVGTQRDNILDSICKGRYNVFGLQKLNAEQVHEIRALAASGLFQKDIAKRFGIARNTVSGIVHGKSWAHLEVRPLVDGGSGADGQPQPLDPTVEHVAGAFHGADRLLEVRGEVG